MPARLDTYKACQYSRPFDTPDYVGVNPAYQSNYDALVYAWENGTSWSGYIVFDYAATLEKPDTRVWCRRYSGIA